MPAWRDVAWIGDALIWRRGWDSNPRSGYPDSGFQDRHVRPLRHPSRPCVVMQAALPMLIPCAL